MLGKENELSLRVSAPQGTTMFLKVKVVILRAVMSETIGERHASACRYKNEIPEGSRRSARRTHFRPRGV